MRWLFPLLVGCSASPTIYVGEVDDTDAVVGLSIAGGAGKLYVCGGPASLGELNRWFEVEIDNAALSGSSEGWEVQASAEGRDWSGSITAADGTGWTFGATRSEARDGTYMPGPYTPEEEVGDCPVGVVVLDGGERMQGLACPPGLAPAQVVPVGILSQEAQRIEVRTDDDPPLEFVVVPVEP